MHSSDGRFVVSYNGEVYNHSEIRAQLEGHKFEDFFARHASIRKEDHRVILDGYLVEVKAKSEAKEPWDFYKLVSVTPAEQAFTPLSESKCKMAELGK